MLSRRFSPPPFAALNKFNGDARIRAWLHRIVVNASLVQLPSRRHRVSNVVGEPLLHASITTADGIDDLATGADATETILKHHDSASDGAALHRATTRQIPVAPLLRDIEELNLDETARISRDYGEHRRGWAPSGSAGAQGASSSASLRCAHLHLPMLQRGCRKLGVDSDSKVLLEATGLRVSVYAGKNSDAVDTPPRSSCSSDG